MNEMLARKIFNGMREQARKEVTQDEWNKWTIEAIEKAIVEAEARGAKAEREACLTIAKNIKETHAGLKKDQGAHAAFIIENLIRVRGDQT
jgi:translation initiation factor 2 beta subunit (eIF-2beta)/eIF-5